MAILADALTKFPPSLRASNDKAHRLVQFRTDEPTPRDARVDFVDLPPKPHADDQDLQSLLEPERSWAIEAIHQFGKRLMMSERSVARITISGSTQVNQSASNHGLSQRFPGVIEEVMLSLALRKPVYIVGTLGGAAEDLGKLLGLSKHWTGDALPSFAIEHDGTDRLKRLNAVARRFRPPPLTRLPVTFGELGAFLRKRAIGGPGWPDNGLSLDENRQLFASTTATEIVNWVRLGLTRRLGGS
jgi:hypothetical protein